LRKWHRDLINIFERKYTHIKFVETNEILIKADRVYYTECMMGFLHHSNEILKILREILIDKDTKRLSPVGRAKRAVSNAPVGGLRSAISAVAIGIKSLMSLKRRIFLVRDSKMRRAFINQRQVAARLASLGFEIVAPEKYSVAGQRELFESAEIVLAASGAGLANLVFCQPGTIVFEIVPSLDRQLWVRSTCINLGLFWSPYFVESHSVADRVEFNGMAGQDIEMAFDVDTNDLVAHVRRVIEIVKKERQTLHLLERQAHESALAGKTVQGETSSPQVSHPGGEHS
jgi:Glycosyltransferase 61